MKDSEGDERAHVPDAASVTESIGVASRLAVEARLFCAAKAALKRAEEAISDLERFEECATTIVMAVAAAESMLNQAALSLDLHLETGTSVRGRQWFDKSGFERLHVREKAYLLALLLHKPPPDFGKKPFQLLQKSIKVRNDLVHEKERAIPHDAGPPEEYAIQQKVTLDAAGEAVRAVAELAKWLRDFVPQVDDAMTDLTVRRD